jgi:hypothetical protein
METEKDKHRTVPKNRTNYPTTVLFRTGSIFGVLLFFAALLFCTGCGKNKSADKKLYRGETLDYYISLMDSTDNKTLMRRGIKYVRAFDQESVKALPKLVALLFYEDVNIATHAATTIASISNYEENFPELRKFEAEFKNAQKDAPPVMYKSLQITIDRLEGRPTVPIPIEGRISGDTLDENDDGP